MKYEIKFAPKAHKFLINLPRSIALRIVKKLQFLSDDPFRFLEHFEGEDYYKLRIGDYRALIDVDFDNHILWIRVLDKRGRIYKR